MNIPIEEIRDLAARLKKTRRDQQVGFTRDELRLICEFPRTFWGGVAGRKGKVAGTKSKSRPERMDEWHGNNFI